MSVIGKVKGLENLVLDLQLPLGGGRAGKVGGSDVSGTLGSRQVRQVSVMEEPLSASPETHMHRGMPSVLLRERSVVVPPSQIRQSGAISLKEALVQEAYMGVMEGFCLYYFPSKDNPRFWELVGLAGERISYALGPDFFESVYQKFRNYLSAECLLGRNPSDEELREGLRALAKGELLSVVVS